MPLSESWDKNDAAAGWNLLGNSPAVREVYLKIRQVAASETTVLLRGELGTGKELAASAIHEASPRSRYPLVKVRCAAIPASVLEDELFGRERGATLETAGGRAGLVERAQHGTLFFDEIAALPPASQVKLLRLLQEREFEPAGGIRTLRADVRVLAATSADLEAQVEAGSFRLDLYYGVNVFPIFLPPLRERKDDILLLANRFVAKYCRQLGKPMPRISAAAIHAMCAYRWPGNVRELESCIEYAVSAFSDGVIHGRDLPPTLQACEPPEATSGGSLPAAVALLEKEMIVEALQDHRGNVTAAAKQLGVTARMIRYRLKKLGIDQPSSPRRPAGRPR